MNEYNKPKSLCKCGHLGDGPNSKHEDIYGEDGAGKCRVKGCKCSRFTWKAFTKQYAEHIKGE